MESYTLVFDKVILNQLKKLGKEAHLRKIISKILDKIEILGPRAGKLLDTKLQIYEIKMKHPPIRAYYKILESKKEAYIFEYEMKTSLQKQKKTIKKIKYKILELES